MAVSIAVPGRGRDDKLPEVKVMDPCFISGPACLNTEVSPQRRTSTMRRTVVRSLGEASLLAVRRESGGVLAARMPRLSPTRVHGPAESLGSGAALCGGLVEHRPDRETVPPSKTSALPCPS